MCELRAYAGISAAAFLSGLLHAIFLLPSLTRLRGGLPAGPLLPSGQQEKLSGVAHQSHVCCPCWSSAPCRDRRGPGRAQRGSEVPQGLPAGGQARDLRGLGRPCCRAPTSPSERSALPFNPRGEGVKCKAGCLVVVGFVSIF